MTPELELTFSVLERALSSTLRIDPDRADAFRARLKQLQRLGFPEGVNVGRGTKMSYSVEHTIQLVFAFELISVGLPAKTSADLVSAGWRRIKTGCREIAKRNPYLSGISEFPIIIAFRPDLLSGGEAQLPTIEDRHSMAQALGNHRSLPGTLIAVDAELVIHRLCDVGASSSRFDGQLIYKAMRRWPEKPKFDVLGDDSWFRVGEFDAEGWISPF